MHGLGPKAIHRYYDDACPYTRRLPARRPVRGRSLNEEAQSRRNVAAVLTLLSPPKSTARATARAPAPSRSRVLPGLGRLAERYKPTARLNPRALPRR